MVVLIIRFGVWKLVGYKVSSRWQPTLLPMLQIYNAPSLVQGVRIFCTLFWLYNESCG